MECFVLVPVSTKKPANTRQLKQLRECMDYYKNNIAIYYALLIVLWHAYHYSVCRYIEAMDLVQDLQIVWVPTIAR